MSFSFSVKATNRADLLVAVDLEMKKVIEYQPNHKKDSVAVLETAGIYLQLVNDPPEGMQFQANVSGSLMWKNYDNPNTIINASIGVNIGHASLE